MRRRVFSQPYTPEGSRKGAPAARYKHRVSDMQELRSFKDVAENRTEAAVDELEKSADVVIDTRACTPEDVLVKAATHLGLFAREYSRLVDVIVGGQFGSEGKGHIASYLSREYAVLVRVGGPNAGHKVFANAWSLYPPPPAIRYAP